jgi:cobalamin biosynthesis protein CobD/CbiB
VVSNSIPAKQEAAENRSSSAKKGWRFEKDAPHGCTGSSPLVMSGLARIGLLGGAVADWVARDPRRWHPVAGFGSVASALERRWWRPSRAAGVTYVTVLVGGVAAVAAVAERGLGRRPAARALLLAMVTWAALGGRSLAEAAHQLAGTVRDGDLEVARRLAPTLVGRDPRGWTARSYAGRRWSRWPRTPPTR